MYCNEKNAQRYYFLFLNGIHIFKIRFHSKKKIKAINLNKLGSKFGLDISKNELSVRFCVAAPSIPELQPFKFEMCIFMYIKKKLGDT